MALDHVFILLLLILSAALQSSGLMSDYKTCGDDACARLLCRVEVVRDHHAQDCRFLSFKKGDMIDVYHKLTGKRSDLWAGSTEKHFGYFPKDAVKIDEVYVDEKKEIRLRTQKTDFFCMDAFGTIISSEEFEDYEFGDQSGESEEELGNSDFDDRVPKAPETNENVETKPVDNDNKDKEKPEQRRSSWIGSAVGGWFATDPEEAGNGNEERENFKIRKLALDVNQLDEEKKEEKQAKVLDWIGDGLSNTLGFGKSDIQDQTENTEDSASEESSYLLGNGIKNVLGFEGGEGRGDMPPSKTTKQSQDENMQNLKEEQEATSLKTVTLSGTITENKKTGEKKHAGWYNSVYTRITNFYRDPEDQRETSKDEGMESSSDQAKDIEISKDEKNSESVSESFPFQDSRSEKRRNQEEKQEVSSEDQTEENVQLGERWYGSVYNRITGFYTHTPDGTDAPDETGVLDGMDVHNKSEDPQVTLESEEVKSSRDKELENADHTAGNNDAGWYDSVYSRISNMYGDTSDVPDAMEDVKNKDTLSSSILSTNDLRSPSEGATRDDEPKLSVTDPSLKQSTDQSDCRTLKSDDDDDDDDGDDDDGDVETEDSELTVKKNSQSQSIFSVGHLSMMINNLKSPFKSNDAGDKEESGGEKTPDTGKEQQSDNDDEISVRLMDVLSEISSQEEEEEEKEEEEAEEEAVQEVNIAEDQINAVESSLDGNKQDLGGDGQNISTSLKDVHAETDSGQSENVLSELNINRGTGLEPVWTELAEQNRTKAHEVGEQTKHFSDKDQFTDGHGEKDAQSEKETRSDSNLHVRTVVESLEMEDEFDEAQDKSEEVDVLPEPEGAGLKVGSGKAVQTIHSESEHEEHGADVVQVEYDEEIESVNVTLMEYDEGKEGGNIIETEQHGGTQVESGGEKEGGVTQVKYVGEPEDVDVAQMESGGDIKSVAVTQVEFSGGQNDDSQIEPDKENEGENISQIGPDEEHEGEDLPQIETGGGNAGVDVPQITPRESEGEGISQIETDGENEGVCISQSENSSGGDVTQVASDGTKESFNFTGMETVREKESVDHSQKDQLSLHPAHGLESTHSISETKQKLEIDLDLESSELKEHESAAEKQAEVTPKSALDKSLSTPLAETEISSMSDGDQNGYVGDKTSDVKPSKAATSPQTQKHAYSNLQAQLSEKDISALLKFFSAETLSRLNFIIAHPEDINTEELAELHGFQQTLEHLLEARNQEIKPSLQTTHTVLSMLRKKLLPVVADGRVDKSPDSRQTKCVSEACVGTTKSTQIDEQDIGEDMDINMNTSFGINDSESSSSKSLFNGEDVITDQIRIIDNGDTFESHQKTASPPDTDIVTEEILAPEESQNEVLLGSYWVLIAELTSEAFTYMMKKSAHVKHAVNEVVMSLPDDIRPGPDLYGLPWEAVIFTTTIGLFTFLLFTCRFIQAVKSRLYCSKERRMGQKVAELLEEKCKVLETLGECERKFKKLDTALQNGGLAAQDSEREDLEVMSKKLEEANAQMKSDMERMQKELDTQDELRKQQEEQLTNLEEMLKKLEEETTERKSQLEQDKTTLKIHEMNTERLQKKLQEAKEENSMLLESKTQLEQEAVGWKERLSELEEEKRMSETSHNRMMENCVNKDERIKSLTEFLLKMRDWDSEEESSINDTTGSESKSSSDLRQKQKVQKLINAAKISADLKAMEEDKDRVFAKLTDEIKAKEDLQEGLTQLQQEKESLGSECSMYVTEIEKLQHKLQIMSEMYQEKELKLHRMLTVEEKERSQKEEQLNKAGKKISMATDELNSYRQRAKDLEDELEKTNQAYRNQIAAHEKKAHDNWLAARAADRDLADVKRENSVLRQRLTDWQFKLELMEKNPQGPAPLFRGERSPFGPSPLGHPPPENRPFLSPPTLVDGPPRVSPQFPMMPGGRAPPGGAEGDRSVSYSESGSPTWERENERARRSVGPPGPDPGLVYRRPLSAPFLRAPLPPESYYNEKSDSSFGVAGFRENGIRDSGRPMPGVHISAGPLPPPPFPPMDPRDPNFPRRGYRPDFFPAHPSLGMLRGPPLPPGVFPRIPLPPHMAFPRMRPPADHISPEPSSRPSPPGSEQPPEQPASAHDII
ncbi:melanoma inhibitory activity protein 2 isoform X1 [Silurus meridionalis]|uniref:SH3 domain-containing protein n=1 Tax=Silurus meridionalis TaxID=175797 RepID=A0A8T0BEZ7_SILME|nr:melanoma inhibitory activity protein 2 isoform X1 [Silurus meridionalis]KAF7704010.1 hypothetical protein HF521_021082 [Silurus meridionalis]